MAKRVLGVGSVSKIRKKFAFITSDDCDSVFFPLEADLTAPERITDLKKRYKDDDSVYFIAREQPGRADCPFHALSVAKESDLQKIVTAVLDVLPDRALLSTGTGTVLLPADAVDDEGRTWGELSDGELRGFLRVGEAIVVQALVLPQAEEGCKRVAVRANRTGVRSDCNPSRSAPRPLPCPIKTLKTRLCSIPSSSQRELVVGVLGVVICASNDEAFLYAKEVGLAHTLLRRSSGARDDSSSSHLSPGNWLVYDVRPQAPTNRLTCIWRAEKLRRPPAEPTDVHLWFDSVRHKLNAEGTALVCNKSLDGQKCYFWNDRIGRMSSTRNDSHCDLAHIDVRSLPVFSVVRFRAYFGGQYEDCPWNVYHLELTDQPATTSVLLTMEKAKISHLTNNNAGFISFRKQSEIFFAFMDLPDCVFVDLTVGSPVRVTAYQQNRCKTSEMRAILVTPLHPTEHTPLHPHPILDARFRPIIDWKNMAKSTSESGRSTRSSALRSNSQEGATAMDDLEKELEMIDFEDELDEAPIPLKADVATASTTLPSFIAAIANFEQLNDDQLSLRESELDTPTEDEDEGNELEMIDDEIADEKESATKQSDGRFSFNTEDSTADESPQSSSHPSAEVDRHDVGEEQQEVKQDTTQISSIADDISWSSDDLDDDLSIERPTSAPPLLMRPTVAAGRSRTRSQKSQAGKYDKSRAPTESSVVELEPQGKIEEKESSLTRCRSRSPPPPHVEACNEQQREEQLHTEFGLIATRPAVFCYAHVPPLPPPPPPPPLPRPQLMIVRPPHCFPQYALPPRLPTFPHGPPMSPMSPMSPTIPPRLPAFSHVPPPMSPLFGQRFFAAPPPPPPPPVYQLCSVDTAPKMTSTTSCGAGGIGSPSVISSTASTIASSLSDDRRLLRRILRDPIIFNMIVNRYPDERARCMSLLEV